LQTAVKPRQLKDRYQRRAPQLRLLGGALAALCYFAPLTNAQSGVKPKPAPPPATPPALTRTATRHETRRFSYGNTLTIYGAPAGAITIEGWQRSQLEVTADIELHADTEADLARLAAVNNFILDEDATHDRVLTTGTHDRKFMQRVAKDFPKQLLGMPWKIDYHLHVPASVDLEIYAGQGPVSINGVEGAIQISAGTSDATLTLTGGDVSATIASGSIDLRVPTHSWRGHGVSLHLARGNVTLELPANFNADINATVLRAGRIDNQHSGVTPRERTTPTERNLQASVGAGGVPFTLEVGDGQIIIKPLTGDK
jgi:hypothetical protein